VEAMMMMMMMLSTDSLPYVSVSCVCKFQWWRTYRHIAGL